MQAAVSTVTEDMLKYTCRELEHYLGTLQAIKWTHAKIYLGMWSYENTYNIAYNISKLTYVYLK